MKERISSVYIIENTAESRRESYHYNYDNNNTFGYKNLDFNLRSSQQIFDSDISNNCNKIKFHHISKNVNLNRSYDNLKKYSKSNIKFDTRYTQDLLSLQSLDISNLIINNSRCFFSYMDFKALDLPDIKNCVQYSHGGENFNNYPNSIHNSRNNINKNFGNDFDKFSNFKTKYKYFFKKMPYFLTGICFIVLLAYIYFS